MYGAPAPGAPSCRPSGKGRHGRRFGLPLYGSIMSELIAAEQMGSGGAAPEEVMSELMAAERPLGSRTRMGSGGAAPEEI
jgi:hypothetical protein